MTIDHHRYRFEKLMIVPTTEKEDYFGSMRSAELRHYYGDISPVTLWRWIKKGYIPPPEPKTPDLEGPTGWRRINVLKGHDGGGGLQPINRLKGN